MTKKPKDENWSAIYFEKPFDSTEHQMLVQDLWLVGGLHSLRYWLGQICGRNLYRESDENVIGELKKYFARQGWQRSIVLHSEPSCWNSIVDVLQLHAQSKLRVESPKRLRETKAVECFLENPQVTDTELAKTLKTTEKQIAKLPSLVCLRTAFARSYFPAK